MISLRTSTSAIAGISLAASTALAKELDGTYTPTQNPCPSVEEAIKKMTVPEGYEVRNFAAEPLVINPVAMTWDHRGRLWVVELFEYPLGAKKPNEYAKMAKDEKFRPVPHGEGPDWPRDRVVVLEDTDNDGKADKRTVFADGLSLATGILCGYGGVFVGQAPNLFFFRDTTGDDKADEYKTVLTGFGMEDRHELLNSFTWGPDGMMYFTHGVFTHSKVRRPGQPQEKGNVLNAGIYRVKFGDTGETDSPNAIFHEVFADGTSNPWGCDYDAAGNWFVEACVIDHLFHMAPGGIYQRQGGAPENPYAYELLPSIVNHKHFRAAYAGIQVYQGGAYPTDTDGHLFFGNIHDNSIHEEKVEPVGATFKASPVRDFLRANDGWFRPVSIQTGPDGNLWVMDWCDKYPCYQNAQANPEGVDRERGRIWRIVSNRGSSRPQMKRDFKTMGTEQLLQRLGDGNNWTRRSAAQELRERKDDLRSPLEQTAAAGKSPAAQGTALQILAARGQLTDAFLASCKPLDDTVARLKTLLLAGLLREGKAADRKAAFALLEKNAGAAASALEADAMARCIRSLSAQTLTGSTPRDWKSDPVGADDLLFELLNTCQWPEDRTLWFHIWQAFEPILASDVDRGLMLAGTAAANKKAAPVIFYKAARRITDTRSAENMDLLLGFLDKIKSDDTLLAHALDGMLKAQEAGAVKPAKVDPAPYFEKWSKSASADVRNLAGRLATLWGDKNAVAALMGLVLDEKADVAKRIDAIRTVRKLRSDQARAGMLKLLTGKSSDALTVEVLRAAAELGGMDLAEAILKGWAGYSPAVRTSAAEVMISRAEWASKLLDGVEGKWVPAEKLNAADIPATARRYFATQANAEMKDRAAKLLGAWNETNADTKALIAAKKKACQTGEPNLENGKTIFTTTCAVCHKFHGGGQEVGPELIGSGRSNLDALLANVIDPNQIIGNGYENVTVTTKDGRTLAGRVTEDTPTQVTLLGIGGRREVVGRGDIAKVENTHQSVMPMGFGALPDEQFRDLIWYILAPPEEGPLTKEKKELLIRGVDGGVEPNKRAEAGKIDWESVSLWNPDWKVTAPEFEGTPLKLTEYQGRKNVLQLHPFEQHRKNPAKLERTLTVSPDKPGKLTFSVASHDKGDWQLLVSIDGKEVTRQLINKDGERWKRIEIDLTPWKGKKINVSLENWANDWMYEFSYWSDLKVES